MDSKKSEPSAGGTPPAPHEVSIPEMLTLALRNTKAPPGAEPMAIQRERSDQSMARRLLSYWSDKTAADMNAFHRQAYHMRRSPEAFRKRGQAERRPPQEPARPGTKPALTSKATIDSELGFLRRARRLYRSARSLNWPDDEMGRLWEGNKRGRRAATIQGRGHLARLAWAARGCTFDSERPCATINKPLKKECFRPADRRQAGRLRTGRRHALRTLLLVYYTGSSLNCINGLRWESDGKHSFVDVEEGMLYRLGTDAAPGKASGMPVPICGRLLLHLRRWRKADMAAGHGRVVHQTGGREVNFGIAYTFGKIRANAGLDPSTTLSDVRQLTGRELMAKGVSPRSASLFMGMAHVDFLKQFERHHPSFRAAVTAAFRKKPQAIRELSATSRRWRDKTAASEDTDEGGAAVKRPRVSVGPKPRG